jgi:hypothetical protein
MKYTPRVLVALAAICLATSLSGQADAKQPAKKQAPPPLPNAGSGGNTPHATISTAFGGTRRTGSMITISYGRPFAKHPRTGEVRQIWGGLVPWDKPDRLGADEATLFVNQHPVVFGSTTIAPGAYTLYIVPSESGTSKLAFSRNIGKWGVPVDDKSDVARIDLTKGALTTPEDQLTIVLENTPAGSPNGVLKIMWDKTQFSAPFTVQK